ncbi:LysE family translocator [Nonomuraea angiospora]|uniref:Threonine/homoserine/homoserine lactone efflux protein n=1 Tax=Nonomuraea angiospora TaxID=46172 RepID=A0ABR9LMV7_9ACTN|nr:LysE family translocator [Nonomuraea angiospora]MBE1581991.1 threonine/homoserine/homoserine lactone efflux protein [Nonomuraea angiospora]
MYLLAFVGACVLVAMAPGVSTAIILRQTLRAGRGSGMAATLGNETGILLWGLAAAFGLSALLVASQLAYDVMRVAGAVVLVVMGAQALWQARKGAPATGMEAEEAVVPGRRGPYLAGLGTCLANPKAAVFAMSFLPQFVRPGQNVPVTLATLAVVWVLVDLAWYGLLIWTVARAKAVLGRPAVRRRLEQISGVVLIGLGVRLAVESR